ncbi:hypothetical protein GIB67_041377 [Kingdonia uniflora]|uniref:BOP1 N-terminal domain-containing protein n=1 Tax=Kingdonia uniflora TaxID=39325 RepID=A0A7J7LRK5_9MAGN|nr:hypothetical protein GIB67_041377 [Kingdonia uniflora]
MRRRRIAQKNTKPEDWVRFVNLTSTEKVKASRGGNKINRWKWIQLLPGPVYLKEENKIISTIGDVPLNWYEDAEHIGYDITDKKITKQAKKDILEHYIANADDSKNWRKIYPYNDEEVELTKQEAKLVLRRLREKTPHAEADLYTPYVYFFEWPDGPCIYQLWGDDSSLTGKVEHGLSNIPVLKLKQPGHEESYYPSIEYISIQLDVPVEPEQLTELWANINAEAEKCTELELQLTRDRELCEKELDVERQAHLTMLKRYDDQITAIQTALEALQNTQQVPSTNGHDQLPETSHVSARERLGPRGVTSKAISKNIQYEPQSSIYLGGEV